VEYESGDERHKRCTGCGEISQIIERDGNGETSASGYAYGLIPVLALPSTIPWSLLFKPEAENTRTEESGRDRCPQGSRFLTGVVPGGLNS